MPDWKQYVRENLPPLSLGTERELEIVDEMAQHLEAIYEEALIDGSTEQQAFERTAAHIKDWRLLECELIRSKRPIAYTWIKKGLAAEARLESRNGRRNLGMRSLGLDVRYGLRLMLKNKAFTAVAVLSLALGIGANTALFSLVDAILLKMLPVSEPSRLVLFSWFSGPRAMFRSISGNLKRDPNTREMVGNPFSYLSFEQLRDSNEMLSDIFAFAPIEQLNVNVDGQSEIAGGQFVTGGYYQGLGVSATAGRTINADDDTAGAEAVVVLTHSYWQRRFGLDPNIIGRTINVNNVPFTIIGVTPTEFHGALEVGQSADLSIPMAREPQIRDGGTDLTRPWSWWLQIMGRLKPGVTAEQARASLHAAFQQSALDGWNAAIALARPQGQTLSSEPRDTPQLRVGSGSQGLVDNRRSYSQPLTILMIVGGLVLLIACANVASLLLARAGARQKEIAIRLAMGASRWRLIRQLLTESVLLAAFGGALGVLLAYLAKDTLLSLRPWGEGNLVFELGIDLRVLGFTIVVSLATGLLFGLAPALRATRADLNSALKDNSRNLASASRPFLTKALVVVQVSLSIVLLIGAALFVRTLRNLEAVDFGFNPRNLTIFRVDPRLSGYESNQMPGLYQRMTERLEGIPGVRSVTFSRHPLLSGSFSSSNITVLDSAAQSDERVASNRVAVNFFETMEMPLLLGRRFTHTDDARAPKVAIVNQTMARRYFGDENPIGRRFGFGGNREDAGKIEIVGVVGDAKYTNLRRDISPTIYIPYIQDSVGQMNFAVRGAGELATSIRDAIREVDSNLPLFEIKTQIQQAKESLAQERLFATLSSFFGVLAMLLSCVGLYGVMSYGVRRRTNEIGIRMALGATPPRVMRMVMRETMVIVGIGVAIGLGTALALTRLIVAMLYGLAPSDPITMAVAVILMSGVAAVSGYIPARRASRVDPMVALRYE